MVFAYCVKFEPACFKCMNKSFTLRINFAVIDTCNRVRVRILYNPIQHLGSYDRAANLPPTLSDISGGTMNSTNSYNSSIELSVKDAGGIYRWTNATSGLENPELNLKVDVNNIIQIQNPTNTKHDITPSA